MNDLTNKHCIEDDGDQWFSEGAAFGFNEDELETLVPPPNAAALVAELLEARKNLENDND